MKSSERALLTSLARNVDNLSPAEQSELARLHQLALGTRPADDVNDTPKPPPAVASLPIGPQFAALVKRFDGLVSETGKRLDSLDNAVSSLTGENAALKRQLAALVKGATPAT